MYCECELTLISYCTIGIMIKLFKVKEKQRELAENSNGKPPVKKQSAGELRLHKGKVHSYLESIVWVLAIRTSKSWCCFAKFTVVFLGNYLLVVVSIRVLDMKSSSLKIQHCRTVFSMLQRTYICLLWDMYFCSFLYSFKWLLRPHIQLQRLKLLLLLLFCLVSSYLLLVDISELNLPKTCSISFPNGKDDLMNFEVTIRPDDGYYL